MKILIAMDYIQKKERCNTIKDIALKFDISQKTAKRLIATLRDMGHQITYSKFSCKYFVEEDKK